MQRSSASGRAEVSVHRLLEEILNEFSVAASLQSSNLLGTAVIGRAFTGTTPGLRFVSGPTLRVLSRPSDVTHGKNNVMFLTIEPADWPAARELGRLA